MWAAKIVQIHDLLASAYSFLQSCHAAHQLLQSPRQALGAVSDHEYQNAGKIIYQAAMRIQTFIYGPIQGMPCDGIFRLGLTQFSKIAESTRNEYLELHSSISPRYCLQKTLIQGESQGLFISCRGANLQYPS